MPEFSGVHHPPKDGTHIKVKMLPIKITRPTFGVVLGFHLS